MASPPSTKNRVVLGLMNFGPDIQWGARVTDLAEFKKFLDFFQEQGYGEVDTARTYQNGSQEGFTASAGWKERGLKLATKLYPHSPYNHSPEALTRGLNKSLAALQTDSVDIYYLHAADRNTPFVDTLETLNKLHQEGKFKELGLSNFTAFEVAEIVTLCKERGWVRPTMYQGIYNAITRGVEAELLPACKRYGLSFLAYNPLAGGFFTGKYSLSDLEKIGSGSLSTDTSIAKIYQAIYFNEAYFSALKLIEPVVKAHGLTMVEVGLRWMVHHSALKMVGAADGVVIGASTVEQLKGSLTDLEKGPLPKEVLDVLDKAWDITRVTAKPYWHGTLKYGYEFDACKL